MDQEIKKINKFDLDTDCIEQPQLFYEAANNAARLAYERDMTKLKLESTYAKLDSYYRKEVQERGEKVTDKLIEALIQSDKDFIKLKEEYITKKLLAFQADNLKSAYEQRKSMLEYIIKLYLSDYYSDVETNPKKQSKI